MASNAEQFKQSFREEAREVLVDLEAALLELNEDRGDAELVGRVFRALHTIKGSGSMFGFEDLAAFTHHLETAYDEVRNGHLLVSSELIDLTLSALDQIRIMLEERQTAVEAARCAEILSQVRRLAGIAEPAPGSAGQAPPALALEARQGAGRGGDNGATRQWAIRFAPGPDLLLNGTNPLLLLGELRQLGGLALKASMDMIPPLAEIEPERCYITWEMVLATEAGRDAVRDVFIFVEDSCELVIEPTGSENPERAGNSDATARALEEPRASSGGRRAYDKPDSATSLRVPAAKLDQFVDLVGVEVQLEGESTVIGALADSVEEVIDLEPDQIQPAPRIGTQIHTDFIKGMGKRDNQFIMILDIDRVFSADELAAVRVPEPSKQLVEAAA